MYIGDVESFLHAGDVDFLLTDAKTFLGGDSLLTLYASACDLNISDQFWKTMMNVYESVG